MHWSYIFLALTHPYDMITYSTAVTAAEHKSEFNIMRPWQNGCHFADNILKCISLNENFWILNKISLNYVKLTKKTSYLALMRDLWSVSFEVFQENWLCYSGTCIKRPLNFVVSEGRWSLMTGRINMICKDCARQMLKSMSFNKTFLVLLYRFHCIMALHCINKHYSCSVSPYSQ